MYGVETHSVATYDTSEDRVWALAVGHDEQQAVTGSADGTLSFWYVALLLGLLLRLRLCLLPAV